MAIGIVRLRKESVVDRKQACLKYLQQRSTPITAIELASKLKMSSKTIHNSLWPLLDDPIDWIVTIEAKLREKNHG